MRFQPKPLSEQTIVITGASSGIGLATARMAAERGARVMLVARREVSLAEIASDLRKNGAHVAHFAADVADEEAMKRVARNAEVVFGGIDTWVNDAAASVYGKITDVPVEDMRRVFETDYWGTVLCSRIAVEHMRERGGTLINIGSILSERSAALQATYSAAKHAIKGFCDALRVELDDDAARINVTLVKPAAIATPYAEHAARYVDHEPKHPGVPYAPEVVAEAILHCAEHPVREITVGGQGKLMTVLASLAPTFFDRLVAPRVMKAQLDEAPAVPGDLRALHAPMADPPRVHGHHEGHVMKSSIYTKLALSPVPRIAVGLALGAVFFRMLRT
jgi:short-subunit dehydrogenase